VRVLVVGGTGPTGIHVINGLIKRGYKVTILHTGAHEVDFIEPVEHLHGSPFFRETLEETLGSRVFDLAIGLYGRTRYVAEAMKGRTPRFIAVGASSYVEGIPPPIPETAPMRKEPNFCYLIWLTEQVTMEAHQQGRYSATFFRYPMVYGPRQMAPTDWSFVRRILDGRKQLILPDNGLVLDSMGYAENLAHALLLAVDKPDESAGQLYNIRDDTAFTVRQRAELIAKIMNHEWEIINIPCELAIPSYPYVALGRRKESWSYIGHRLTDIGKIKYELGYRDIVPVEEAIEQTVKWLLEHRPELGGTVEKALSDTFDYDNEDRLIQEFRAFHKKASKIPFNGYLPMHSYAHPKKPEE
jgi:nucleoside-diphosphate-sugar epimerase